MKKVIILTGPTCVGKTGVSLLLSRKLHTEIISADSMQIYRHMDIGTAKLPLDMATASKTGEGLPRCHIRTATRMGVVHHMVDILEPSESFSAGQFRDRAVRIIDKLHERGKIPIVVGGTGLYIRAITHGIFEGPSADWTLRRQLEEEERQKGSGYLYGLLKAKDPAAASKIKQNDMRRTIRAVEVYLKEKRPISELQHSMTFPHNYDLIKICLTRDRGELYSMIEQRVDSMIEDGLLNEVRVLMDMNPCKVAMQAIGYKEMASYLHGEIGLDEAVGLIKLRTRRYAKRQLTWFRKDSAIYWVDVTGMKKPEEIFEKLLKDVEILREILYGKKKKGEVL